MEHAGPQMSNTQEKRPTAADRVDKLQDEYDALVKRSADKIQQVVSHNQTYPKLRQVLDKRRALVDVPRVKRNKAPLNSKGSRRRTAARKPSRTRRTKNTRAIKKRTRKICSCSKCVTKKNMLRCTRGSQFNNCIMVMNRRIGTDVKLAGTQESTSPRQMMSPTTSNTNFVPGSSFQKETATKEVASKPSSLDSGIPSVSSFHSYYSTDHEPMI